MEKKRQKDKICEIIKQRISHYEYKPGEALRESELMKEFSIGRTPVREAFIQLSSQGLIEIIPVKGTFVKKISFGEVLQVYEVRSTLIELSGQLAAQRITHQGLEEIEKELEKTKDTSDRNSILQLDAKIHVIIDKSTQNLELAAILDNLKIKFLSIWEYPMDDFSYYDSMYNDFILLLDALKKREVEKSGTILRQHLKKALSQFEKIL